MNVRLIVPKLTNEQNPIERYGLQIATIARGFTAFEATGGWIDNEYHFIVEPVVVFDIDVVSDLQFVMVYGIDELKTLARKIAYELQQTWVYFSVDGKVEYIGP